MAFFLWLMNCYDTSSVDVRSIIVIWSAFKIFSIFSPLVFCSYFLWRYSFRGCAKCFLNSILLQNFCIDFVATQTEYKTKPKEKEQKKIGSKLQDLIVWTIYFWFVICDFGLFKLTVNKNNTVLNSLSPNETPIEILQFVRLLIETFLIIYRYRDDALCWTDR